MKESKKLQTYTVTTHNRKVHSIEAKTANDAVNSILRLTPQNEISRIVVQYDNPKNAEGLSSFIDFDAHGNEATKRQTVISLGDDDSIDLLFIDNDQTVGNVQITGTPVLLHNLIPQIASFWRDGSITL
jgi:hypothetical protein